MTQRNICSDYVKFKRYFVLLSQQKETASQQSDDILKTSRVTALQITVTVIAGSNPERAPCVQILLVENDLNGKPVRVCESRHGNEKLEPG
jgi:hypothetical protein